MGQSIIGRNYTANQITWSHFAPCGNFTESMWSWKFSLERFMCSPREHLTCMHDVMADSSHQYPWLYLTLMAVDLTYVKYLNDVSLESMSSLLRYFLEIKSYDSIPQETNILFSYHISFDKSLYWTATENFNMVIMVQIWWSNRNRLSVMPELY